MIEIGIIGVIVSLLTEAFKRSNMSGFKKQAIAVVLSIVAGIIYFNIKDTALFENILAILATATLIYEYIIKAFK